ncbi:hypothetical protein ACHAWF_008594 [Thalassiosira exigua]
MDDVDDDRSPNALAEAAYSAAVAQMEGRQRKKARDREEGGGGGEEEGGIELRRGGGVGGGGDERGESRVDPPEVDLARGDVGAAGTTPSEPVEDAVARVEEIWKGGGGNDNDDDDGEGGVEAKISATLRLVLAELDGLTKCGLGAFHDLDATSRQLVRSRELAEARSREAKRLQDVDEQSRASLSNLLRAVESSKSEARDASRSAQLESRLRSDVRALRDERDRASADLSDARRKLSLLEEELRLTKSKLGRVAREKAAMERDSRAAISLARSLDHNNSSDANYYKRKVGELGDQLRAARDTVAKQAGTIAELRGERERPSVAGAKRIRKSY